MTIIDTDHDGVIDANDVQISKEISDLQDASRKQQHQVQTQVQAHTYIYIYIYICIYIYIYNESKKNCRMTLFSFFICFIFICI